MKFNLNRLKAERIAKGFTQEEIGEKIGITKSGYSKLESGQSKIDIDTFVSILTVLGLNPEDLVIFFTC